MSSLLLGFGGVVASMGNLYVIIATAAWSTWAMAAIFWALKSNRIQRAVLAAAPWALAYFGGEGITLLAVAIMTIALGVTIRPSSESWGRFAVRFAKVLVVAGVMAIALVAVNMLPTMELLKFGWEE